MKLTCPACARVNAPHLKRCLYCGATLPAPINLERPQDRELTPEADQRLTEALKRGDTRGVAALLEDRPGAAAVAIPQQAPAVVEPEPAVLSDLNVEPLGAAYSLAPEFIGAAPLDPTELPESPLSDPVLLDPTALPASGFITPADPTDLPWGGGPDARQGPPPMNVEPVVTSLDAESDATLPPLELMPLAPLQPEPEVRSDPVLRLVDEARIGLDEAVAAWYRGDARACEEKISQTMAHLQRVRVRVRPAPAPPPKIKLPNFRAPYALVVDGTGNGELSSALAEALGVDIVTARLQAICRYPRLALQGESRSDLEMLARRVRLSVNLRASVVPRSEVFDVPAPLTLRRVEGMNWRLGTGELWNDTAESEPDVLMEPPTFTLACTGEIVIRRYRRMSARRGRGEDGWRMSGEKRLAVLDLHGSERLLRIVEGVTSFEGLPGYEPSSAPASFRNFIEALPELYPGIDVSGRRVCLPRRLQPAPKAERPILSGWEVWEEHTRLCRLHEARRRNA